MSRAWSNLCVRERRKQGSQKDARKMQVLGVSKGRSKGGDGRNR